MPEEVTEADPQCIKCGSNKFELMRTINSQIVATCVDCGEQHLLEATDIATGKPTRLQFWSPEMDEN